VRVALPRAPRFHAALTRPASGGALGRPRRAPRVCLRIGPALARPAADGLSLSHMALQSGIDPR